MKMLQALALAGALVVSAPALAQEKAAVKPGFTMPTDRPVRILVFRPDVKVGSQSAGGVVTPNAEWTTNARKHLADALVAAKPGGASEVVFMPDLEGENEALLNDYRSLFKGVAATVLQHRLFKGDRLPTKITGFEYTLGPGAAKLGELGGGDYGLFVVTNDAYGDSGRKALQVFGLLMGAATGFGGMVSSGVHAGYAGLVDLRTGDLVWLNADLKMGGDVRDADGAGKRVVQLLEDFPQQGASFPARTAAQ
ncbi:hypothetical protein HJG53_06630 [Sphingomonas sp. ID1715]|uniref:hypothetical protein n=1 Tax=Sphingomonas sp. ID1715 TaxID=1656898 RepID=UPI00148881D9|nr:hypothetical protein [Sphingomonas sp. ID1715]NNM76576.1 hypothetical protein [Sphingomonas sp. ID1715]